MVGSLRLEGPGALRGGHDQRGGKEFGAVVFDLLNHFLEDGPAGLIRAGADLCPPLPDLLFEGCHHDGFARMIESLARVGWGEAQSLAQLLEELDMGFHWLEGASQGVIGYQALEVQVQVVKGQIFPPGFAGRRRFEGLEV